MINVKLGKRERCDVHDVHHVTAWGKEKNLLKSQTGFGPMTFRAPAGCSNH